MCKRKETLQDEVIVGSLIDPSKWAGEFEASALRMTETLIA